MVRNAREKVYQHHYLVIHAGRSNLRDKDMVRGTSDGDSLSVNLTQNSDRKTGTVEQNVSADCFIERARHIPRERVTHHEVSVNAQLPAKFSDFILELI
jgi:hypothetical protein